MKIKKDNNKKECWAEKRAKDSNLNDYIQNKAIKEEKGSKPSKKEKSG